jgi:ATP-dependent protease ClpP protease subunit
MKNKKQRKISAILNMRTDNWFNFKPFSEENDSVDLMLYGVIGGDWFGDGVQAEDFNRDLNRITASTINLHINSPGGSVWDGYAIMNSLMAWMNAKPGRTIVGHVDGIAASIASAILMAAPVRKMPSASRLMIHEPWTWLAGNAAELRATADDLDKISADLVDIYAKATGQTPEKIKALMTGAVDGTYLTASDALSLGFATEILESVPVAACAGAEMYDGLPRELYPKDQPGADAAAPIITALNNSINKIKEITNHV